MLSTWLHNQRVCICGRDASWIAHPSVWKLLPDLVRHGAGNGAEREFGKSLWDHLSANPDVGQVFDEAMSSYSGQEAPAVRHALRRVPLGASVLCDVGGGHGTLLDAVLQDHPAASGIVFDLPPVIARASGKADGSGSQSISYVGGDMFESVPAANVYFLKHILHDWPDSECSRILSTLRRAAMPKTRIFICEFVVPGPQEAHFSKLFDIHMMVLAQGRERTEDQYAKLLQATGWRTESVTPIPGSPLSILGAVLQ